MTASKLNHAGKRVVLLSYPSDSFGRDLTISVMRCANLRGDRVFRPGTEAEIPALIKSWRPDGLLLRTAKPALRRLLNHKRLPAVFFAGTEGVRVISDYAAIGRQGAQHLLERGFRHCGYLHTGILNAPLVQRGFIEALRQSGIDCSVHALTPLPIRKWSQRARVSEVGRWIVRLKRPVALLLYEEFTAQYVLLACEQLGLRVPQDVAVLTIGNDEIHCLSAHPPLSSVQHDTARIGFEACSLLHDLMSGGVPPRHPVLIPPKRVVTRATTNVLAIDDPVIAAALSYVHEHVDDALGVEDLLAHVSMSRRPFERRFRRSVGRSPAAYIRVLRIERAKRLLEETDLKMPNVALACGFTRPQELWRMFRKLTGQSPETYRQEMRRHSPGAR